MRFNYLDLKIVDGVEWDIINEIFKWSDIYILFCSISLLYALLHSVLLCCIPLCCILLYYVPLCVASFHFVMFHFTSLHSTPWFQTQPKVSLIDSNGDSLIDLNGNSSKHNPLQRKLLNIDHVKQVIQVWAMVQDTFI